MLGERAVSRILTTAAALAACVSSVVASAQPLPVKEPTEPWVVNYDTASCLLQRNYGSKEEPEILVMELIPTLDSVGLYVLNDTRGNPLDLANAQIRLGAAAERLEKKLSSFPLKGSLYRHRTSLERAELEPAVNGEVVALEAGKRVAAVYKLPGFGRALAAADECVADLLASLGMSREQQSNIGRFAKAIGKMVDHNDYPSEALAHNEIGETAALVRVNASGKASDCKVLRSSGSRSLDSATCRAMLRARYDPALDKAGQPIDSIAVNHVEWLMIG